MKFIVDARLPPRQCGLLQAAGHDAVHTQQLTEQNRTTDNVINDLSVKEKRVVVTKDTDFYHSHVLHGRPWKLLLVRTGNTRVRELKALFQQHLSAIEIALEHNSLVELGRGKVRVVRLKSRRAG